VDNVCGYVMDIWIFNLDKHGYPRILIGQVSMDISLGYMAWTSLDAIGYLLDISSGYLFLDMSERYPILPKDIQEISFHIQRCPMISRDIQQYPEISQRGELPDGQHHAAAADWSAHALRLGQQPAPALPLHLPCGERAGARPPHSVFHRQQQSSHDSTQLQGV
jgi:hypothetical protein